MNNSQKNNILSVDRAISDLRRGLPVIISDGSTAIICQPIETYHPELSKYSWNSLLLTKARARFLGIGNDISSSALKIDASNLTKDTMNAISGLDLETNQSPDISQISAGSDLDGAALALCKLAELIPSALVQYINLEDVARICSDNDLLAVDFMAISSYPRFKTESINLVSETIVPLKYGVSARVACFRPSGGGYEHMAIIVEQNDKQAAPAVRVHSSCITGDVLGSLRCDCGDQYHAAMEIISREGGVLVYVNQEGRGIGIGNKIRAYCLQDGGLDTVEANQALGYEDDEREFEIAARMLIALGISSLRLITNNPKKVDGLKKAGFNVVSTIPLKIAPNDINRNYLATKAEKMGHAI